MFLDPEPRPPRHAASSGFFSSRTPIVSPRDIHRTAVRRKALHERTLSQNNQARAAQLSEGDSPEKSTVRLIPYSSSPAMRRTASKEAWGLENSAGKENDPSNTPGVSRWAAAKEVKEDVQVSAKDDSAQNIDQSDFDISDTTAFSIGDQASRTPRPSTERAPRIPPPVVIPKLTWHRRSTSSGVMSDSSTLYFQRDTDGSSILADNLFQPSESRRQTQLSFDTTLQGTPTPYESEVAENSDFMKPPLIQPQPLQTWPEVSLERSTMRVIDSPGRSEVNENDMRPLSSQASVANASTDLPDEPTYTSALQDSDVSRSHSISSTANFEAFGSSPPRVQRDDSTFVMSDDSRLPEFSSPGAVSYTSRDGDFGRNSTDGVEASRLSSPNFVAYSSPPPRSPTRRGQLQTVSSFESIESRLQYPALNQTNTPSSQADHGQMATIHHSSSIDTLPPLRVPRRRIRHLHAAAGLRSGSNSEQTTVSDTEQDEINPLPYPRQVFSTHLSTIASESDRTGCRHLSQFSMFSSRSTDNDASRLPASETWPQLHVPASNGYQMQEEAGDMTLEIYREESALPLPLFHAPQSTNMTSAFGSEHEDPSVSPTLGSGSGDTEESFDQLADLHTMRLRAMRSGQSLRQRSNSTPSRSLSLTRGHSRHQSFVSYQSSIDRPGSSAGSLFPFWARQYYGHGVALMSASKVSLVMSEARRTSIAQQQIPQILQHSYGDSEWTDTTSGDATSVSGSPTQSPASHRFLPRIFRPRTRLRSRDSDGSRKSPPFFRTRQRNAILASRSKRLPIRVVSESPAPEHGDDEMLSVPAQAAETLCVPANDSEVNGESQVPHVPKHDFSQTCLSHEHDIRQSYPHRDPAWPSHHNNHDLSQFQDPTSHSARPFHLESTPRLHVNGRNIQQGLPTWQAPSFVDSLDTLVRADGNRQILLFVLGFVFPPFWILGALLPIPRPPSLEDGSISWVPAVSASPSWVVCRNSLAQNSNSLRRSGEDHGHNAVNESIRDAMLQRQAEQEQRVDVELDAHYRAVYLAAERTFLKAQWWRTLNRIMSVVGVLIIAAIIGLAVVSTSV